MKRKQQRGEDTATRLLDAALAVHAAHGREGFTVHAVVERSRVSLGSLYHHFGSFDGLAAALFAQSMAALLDAMVAALEGVTSPRAGVTALVRAYLAFTGEQRARAMFIHASSYASFLPAHAGVIEAAKGPRIEKIAAFLRPHVRSGKLAELSEPMIEMLLVGPVAEVSRRWLAGQPGIDLAEAARVLPERVWRGLRRE